MSHNPPGSQLYLLPAKPGSPTAKWFHDNVTEWIADLGYIRTTATLEGDITIGSLDSHLYAFDGTWGALGRVGDALKVVISDGVLDLTLDGVYSLSNLLPDSVGLIASSDGTLTGETLRLTSTALEGKNPLDVWVMNTSPLQVEVTASALPDGAATEVTLAALLVELMQKTEPTDAQLTTAVDFDIRNLVFATDKVDVSGSVIALDPASLSALENITVSIDNVNLDVRDLTHVSDSIRLGDGTTLTEVTANKELKVHDEDALTQLTAIAGLDFATETTLAALLVELMQKTEPTDAQLTTAVDFDIRNLLFATDKVDVSGSVIALDATSLAALENITVTIDNANLDVRDLTHVSDSIRLGDGTTLTEVTANKELKVHDEDALVQLTAIAGFVNDLEGYTDGLETLVTSSNTKLDTINTNLGSLSGYVDGLEGLLTTLNAKDFATETTLAALSAKLNSDYGASTGAIRTASQIGNTTGAADFNSGVTGAQTLRVSVATDSGLATAANQATEIISLSSIDGKLNSLGQKTMAGSVPITLASDQTVIDVSETLSSGGLEAEITVGTTPVEVKVGVSKLAGRVLITAQPVDADMWWGYTSGVTTATGTKIFKDQVARWAASDVTTVYLVASAAGKKARVTESP
jgi:hypothetical protein